MSVTFDVDDPRYRITPSQQMLSSCGGALVTSVLVTPLDVVKIRLQAQQQLMLSKTCFVYCNGLMDHLCPCINCSGRGKVAGSLVRDQWYRRPGQFNGTMDAFIKIVRNEGVGSLWSGLSPTLVLAVPATVVYFTTYEQLRIMIKELAPRSNLGEEQPIWLTALMAGAMARTWSVTLVSPLELIRTKMQSKKLSYSEVSVAIRELVNVEGWRGLWRGLVPSLLRDVPFSALYWACYESYKKTFACPEPTLGQSFVGGAVSGGVAALVTLPFDVVKTLRQIELGEKVLYTDKPGQKTSSTSEIFQRIYRDRGWRGLYVGLVPRLIKVAPACAVMISSYEYAKHFFSQYNHRREHDQL